MGWLNQLPWTSTKPTEEPEDTDSDIEDKRPPKPDETERVRKVNATLNEVGVEYRNGDSETLEAYRVERSEAQAILHQDPTPRWSSGFAKVEYGTETINYETLAREPIVSPIEEHTFVVEMEMEWSWGFPNYLYRSKEWVASPSEMDLRIEERE